MNNLDYLISNIYSKGIIYKKLSDVSEIKRGQRVTKEFLNDFEQYPVISGGVTPMGFLNEYNRGENTITVAQYGTAGYIDWQKNKFWANDVCYSVFPKEGLVNRFLYHFLLHKQNEIYLMKTNAIPAHLPQDKFSKLLIPLPAIEIQNEIVQILDNFMELIAELTSELTARVLQHEYYKKLLLSRGSKIKLKEIAFYSKNRINVDKLDRYTFVGVDNLMQNRSGKRNSDYIPKTGNVCEFKNEDILIGNIRPYLKKIWFSDIDGGASGDVLIIRVFDNKIILPRYLYYVLSSDHFFKYDVINSRGAKMPRGDKDKIMEYDFLMPSLKEQKYIVDILDKFDKLVNDVNKGIPAEIATRKKQYEYYRDKLLTFKEVGNESI